MQNEEHYIYGRNPVQETLFEEPDKIEKIFVRDSLRKAQIKELLDEASTHKIPVSWVPGGKLYQMVGSVNDQGIVALLSPVTYLELQDWLSEIDKATNPAVLLLDEIEDPHNFGAIIRSAAGLGLDGIIIAKHRQAPVNATVFKTSAGAVNKIPIIRVVNLNQTILTLKEEGFWIAGLSGDGEHTIWDHTMDMPLGFIIGNEGEGIRRKTLEHCDFTLNVPMHAGVESLNASVSAALICYEWRRRRDS